MKKNYILGGIALLLVSIYLVLFLVVYKPDNIRFKNEYEKLNNNADTLEINIDKDNRIKYVNIKQVFDILENKTGIIYFGFPSCPWCRNIIPTLLEVAKNQNQTVYYFNPQNIRNSGGNNYEKLLKILNDYLDSDNEGNKKLFVPDVYFVKDGKIKGHHLGSLDSQTNPNKPLTESQRKELEKIFLDLIMKIKP